MAEYSSNSSFHNLEYSSDKETWSEIIAAAKTILRFSGTVRDKGIVDADWDDDSSGKRFCLSSIPYGSEISYSLKISDQFAASDAGPEPIIMFSEGKSYIGGLFNWPGDYTSTEQKYEFAEIDLQSYLKTHPALSDYSS